MVSYKLEKRLWTEADFEVMGWHDSHIYRIRLSEDLEMDIDYILKWNEPDVKGLHFTFWVAPATLVFKRVANLSFELETGLDDCFEIEDIERTNSNEWTIITRVGNIQFTSEGYEQFIRQDPSFQFGQTISFAERNGYSLDRVTNQENPNLVRDDIIEKRRRDLELYEYVKQRRLKKIELEELINDRDQNNIDTKQYLIQKKEINEIIFSCDFFLKGTDFENW